MIDKLIISFFNFILKLDKKHNFKFLFHANMDMSLERVTEFVIISERMLCSYLMLGDEL